MSDKDNVWKQPEAPPSPLFTGKKEKDLVKQVTDELTERVIKSEVVYYPISLKHSNFHDLYGEAVDKSFLPPVHVSAYVEWQGTETTATNLGVDKKSTIVVHFHKRRLTEDKNLFVREGDFVLYGKHNYEIVSLGQPRPLFGQIDSQIEIVATCVKARDGVIPEQKPVASNIDDDPRLTAPACDPLTELRVLDGTGTDTGGSGGTPTVCDEVSERPGNPPPPLFTGVKETALVKQINDEVLERVIGQQVVYFPVSAKHSNFHSLYGESVNKTFLPPVRIYAAVDWQGSETTTENYGVDKKSKVTVRFHKRRLTEDQNLFVRIGDFVLYGKILYEIVSTGQPTQLFGQVGQKFEIVAECIKAREGVFKLSPQKQDGSLVDVSSIDPCDNATFINIGEGEKNTGKNIGSGEGIFSGKVGKELQFKSLVAGNNIVINSTGTEIAISSSGEISGTITNAQTASIAVNADKLDDLHATDFTLQYITSNGATTTNTLSVADLSASVNISASAFYGDGSNITGVTAEWDGTHTGDAAVTGELSASTFVGDGSSLTGIAAVNINGTVANATSAVTAQTASYVVTAQTASYVAGSNVNGAVANATNSVTAQTASYVVTSQTASYISAVNVDGTVANATSAVTAQTASYVVTAQTASYYVETDTLQSVTDRGATSTGTISVAGLSASVNVSASGFYGDGSNLTGVTGEWDGSHTGDATITGNLSASVNISASAYYGDGSNLTGISTASTLDQITDNGNTTTNDIAVGNVISDSLTGSLHKLRDGSPYLVAGSNVTINYEANGQITISSTGGGGGGGGDTIITTGNGVLTIADDGPGGTYRALLEKYHVSASSYSSKILYLANIGTSPVTSFQMPHKFYFNENGVWHPSPFFTQDPPESVSTGSIMLPDLHDILTLDGNNSEDRAILTGFHANSGSYSGRAIYVSSTGSAGSVGPFSTANKYYFNENGEWYDSPFVSG